MIKLLGKIKAGFKKLAYSLKARMLFVVCLGSVAGILGYIILRFLINTGIDTLYNTPEKKLERLDGFFADLQTYIDKNELSSEDTAKITSWVKEKKFVYLFIYKDDELFYSGGAYDPGDEVIGGGVGGVGGGVTVDYPTMEEVMEYAEKNGLRALTLSDGTLFASLTDFTEYVYYDIANLVSLAGAIGTLALILFIYFYDITRRLSLLSDDVSIVSEVDVNHRIRAVGNDELATLSGNIENMRAGILENLEKEREARDANTELITSMSHDIRTPLTVLLGYLDIMKMQAEDETMQTYIRESQKTALRLKDLSDDMFRYFLVYGNSDIEAELADYDAPTLLSQMLTEHSLYLSENGYTFEATGETGIVKGLLIRTDAPKLMRIIDNVYSNILKYADKSEPIKLSFRAEGERLTIEFANGIAEDSSHAESNGIGLKTSKRLADMLGAALSFGKVGTKFYVRLALPLLPAPAESTNNK